MNDKVEEMVERVRLTDEEIQNIYKERNWLIFSHELYRLQAVAKAQLNKVLKEDLALIDRSVGVPLPDSAHDTIAYQAALGDARRMGYLPVIPTKGSNKGALK